MLVGRFIVPTGNRTVVIAVAPVAASATAPTATATAVGIVAICAVACFRRFQCAFDLGVFGLLGFGVGHSGRFLAVVGLDGGPGMTRCCLTVFARCGHHAGAAGVSAGHHRGLLLLVIGGFSHLNKLITDLGSFFLFLERFFLDDVVLLDVLFDDGSRSCALGRNGAGLFRRVHHLALFDQERLLRIHASVRGDGDRDLETLFEIAQVTTLVVENVERHVWTGPHDEIVRRPAQK